MKTISNTHLFLVLFNEISDASEEQPMFEDDEEALMEYIQD